MMQSYEGARNDKLEYLMRSVQAGRIVHALLFIGPKGTGKRTAANRCARTLLCTGQDKPCGVCPACRKYLAGLHPDVRILRPEKNVIRVSDIRSVLEYLSLRPYENGWHIVIIEQAETMNESAQNALLKTLENPSGKILFILISDKSGGLLSTILSRCQIMRFCELSVDACADVLMSSGIEQHRSLLLSGIARGSVGQALELHDDPSYFVLREKVLEALESLSDSASVAHAAAQIADEKEQCHRILDIMELWARDRMVFQNGGCIYERCDSDRLMRCKLDGVQLLKAVIHARAQIKSNISWVNVLETMCFGLIN